MRLLLDPLILLPSTYSDLRGKVDDLFWQRIVDWSSDRRVFVGRETLNLILGEYTDYGYPQKNLSESIPEIRADYSASLNRLLSRIASPTDAATACEFDPEYKGGEYHYLALQLDVSGASTDVGGIATSPTSWAEELAEVTIVPGPPDVLELCFEANSQLISERYSFLREYFSDKKIHIVGGRPENRIVDALQSMLGIGDKNLEWIPCEKSRPPRDLDKRWAKLKADRDIVICITGRVGHATSINAKKAAEKNGIEYIPVESSAEILAVLRSLPRNSPSQKPDIGISE